LNKLRRGGSRAEDLMPAPVEPTSRVLIVDDEPINRELLAAFLHNGPYDVTMANSGVEALALAQQQLPDLVLLDVMMPELDGFETTRRLKALAGSRMMPIILVTAMGDARSRVQGYEAGADEFVTKPVDRLELLARLRNLDALRRDRRALAEQNEHLLRLRAFQQQATFLMVHDLKNPLAAVALNLGFAQMQLRNVSGTDDVQGALDDARSACQRLQRLIAEVLDTSRAEDGQLHLAPASVEVAQLVGDALADFVPRARDERLLLSDRTEDGRIQVDVETTKRAVQSLLENAFKFTPSGKRIELTTTLTPETVTFQVSCDAPKMSEAAEKTAFEKYVPAIGQPAGTVHRGHGLYYASLIAQAHGGQIEFAKHPMMETAFRLVLPRVAVKR
jgi:DNA-binding response OmpR family regulator